MNSEKLGIYEFGEFQLDLAQKQLRREGKPVSLTPKVFDTLTVLVERSSELIAKEDLMKAVWKDTFVEEKNLTFCIHTLRKALGQEADKTTYIETIPKRGYRFNASVKFIPINGASSKTEISETPFFSTISTRIELVDSKPSDRSIKNQTKTSKRTWAWIAAGVAALALGCVLVYVWRTQSRPGADDYPLGIKTIAVLPFTDVGEKKVGEDHLREGVTDATISNLSRIRALEVLPTSSIQKYFTQNFDPITAGRELKADAVLEGTIRRDRDVVRINVRLLRISDSAQLLAETFTAKPDNLLELENIVSLRTARALFLELEQAKTESTITTTTTNPEALRLYLQGRQILNSYDLNRASETVGLFQKAIVTDPNFALAYAGLADALLSDGKVFYQGDSAETNVNKALQLNPNLAEAHATLGRIYFENYWDWQRAETEFRKALELNPDYAPARHQYARMIAIQRRFSEAEKEMKKAIEIDPFSPYYRSSLCRIYYYDRLYAEAIEQCKVAQTIDPEFWLISKHLFWIYAKKKMNKELVELVFKKLSPAEQENHPLTKALSEPDLRSWWQHLIDEWLQLKKYDASTLASLYIMIGEKEKALKMLENGASKKGPFFLEVNADPIFDDLRDNPRFISLMLKIGLQPN